MPINDWPVAERPREKLLQRGAAALSDAELLAVLLRNGNRGNSAVGLARQLLGVHGGLRALLKRPTGTLLASPGLGPGKVATLLAALELGRRHLRDGLTHGPALTDPAATLTFLRARLRDYPYEVFAALFLDNRHRVIAFDELFRGTIDGAGVHPREVVRRCLEHNAAAVIFAHNHPSGVCEPSGADRAITTRLREALALIDVRVLDHIVVGDLNACSMAERGWL